MSQTEKKAAPCFHCALPATGPLRLCDFHFVEWGLGYVEASLLYPGHPHARKPEGGHEEYMENPESL